MLLIVYCKENSIKINNNKNMPSKNKSIVIFENDPVRRFWSEKEEKWYF